MELLQPNPDSIAVWQLAFIYVREGCNMLASEARIATASASKYLQQFCKHWSHKFEVEFTPEQGRVPFAPDRVCDFAPTPDALTLRVQAGNEEELSRTERVVIDHLKRFAFREDLGSVEWRRL
jgi:hypothetical protein